MPAMKGHVARIHQSFAVGPLIETLISPFPLIPSSHTDPYACDTGPWMCARTLRTT
jgi:hypothetical protein